MNKITTIVPIYNVEDFLNRCISSIMNQTYKNLEIILVNDGSTDSSGEICDSYAGKDSRIQVIHKKNGGLISARMAGLNIATGTYITFVDGDDWIEENTYSSLMDILKENPNADIIIGGYVNETNNGEVIYPFLYSNSMKLNRFEALNLMFEGKIYNWFLCDKIYRKGIIPLDYVWQTQNPYGEDTEYNWVLFNNANDIIFKPVYGYHYMINTSSMMHQKFSWSFFAYLDRLNNILHQIEPKQIALRKRVMKLFFEFGINYFLKILSLANDNIDWIRDYKTYKNMLCNDIDVGLLDLSKEERKIYSIIIKDYENPIECYNFIVNKIKNDCEKFCKNSEFVFIYGAGIIGKKAARFMEEQKISFEGFVVTDNDNSGYYLQYPILSIDCVIKKCGENCKFILGVNKKNKKEVIETLKTRNIYDYFDLSIVDMFI